MNEVHPALQSSSPPFFQKWFVWILVAQVFAGTVRLVSLGAYPLMDTTEARYAEIARGMLASGDWITPRLDPATPFWGKPPLSFWFTAVSLKIFGVNEFGARLPAYFIAVVMVILTYYLAAQIYGRRIGALSGAILSTSGLFYTLSGAVMPDCALALFVTVCMVSLHMAVKSKNRRSLLMWAYLFFTGIALSILSKGLVGVVFIGLAAGAWALWKRQWRSLWRLPWVSGSLLCFLIAAPWFYAAETRTPGFLKYFFVGEHFLRFVQPSWNGDLYGHPHNEPLGTAWMFSIVSACPWVFAFAASLIWLKRKSDIPLHAILSEPDAAFLIAWTIMPVVFLTAARNIMFPYVLPCMPSLAIMTAYVMDRVMKLAPNHVAPWFISRRAVAFGLFCVPVVSGIAAFTAFPVYFGLRSQKATIALFQGLSKGEHATLVYTDRMPLSAEFYTRGNNVEDNPGESKQRIETALHDAKLDYYAIEISDLHEFPPDGFLLTEKVARLGRFEIRREFSPAKTASLKR